MKRLFIVLLFGFAMVPAARAQRYEMKFVLPAEAKVDSVLYLGQHYRDALLPMDSATRQPDGTYTFAGRRKWDTGIYALFARDAKKSLTDFAIDGSQRFTLRLTADGKVADPQKDVVGSAANQAMFSYINRIQEARQQARDIEGRKKSADTAVRATAQREMEQLSKEMSQYEKEFVDGHQQYLYFRLARMMGGPEVPDSVQDKPLYYRTHYWDGVDWSDHSLVRTPDLFNKMNYFFFGVLYHLESDTVCRYADRLLDGLVGDTLMLRYVLDYVMPKYYRSTKNIGWDATWCHLVRRYYLGGHCPWASESDLANKRQTVEFLEQSLIGAMGQELYMADTNQSPDPRDWISSHRFPQRYVILWFWDPDCHHCQEQTATLKQLYDSLSAVGNRPFEVYAVGYEADVDKWKRYVREHQLPFVNVGGQNVNIDYQVAYNVHGAPTMIILNEERRIIMNKVLATKDILPFLKRYEESKR